MPSLEIVLGLILIILFYSLLATIIMELIAGFMAMRGKHLEKVLQSMLANSDRREELFAAFKNNTLYQQLAGKPYGKKTPPSYLTSTTFRDILTKVIDSQEEGDSFREKIEAISDHDLKELLGQFWEETGGHFEKFSLKIESWYDDVMDRASGWYKNSTQKILLILGLTIAVVFNVDTLSVYRNLSNSSRVDLEQILTLAESTSRSSIYILPNGENGQAFSQPTEDGRNQQTFQLIEDKLENLKDPLGIGWDNMEMQSDIPFWIFKIFGWLVTALCISKGAPFWFDLLRKAVNFRSTGVAPSQRQAVSAAPAPTNYTQVQVKPQAPLKKEENIHQAVG